MPKRFLLILSMAAGLGLPHSASAYDECTFQSNTGRIANSYELIGVEACIALCTETDGCTAWMYSPNTFNPDGAPGQCQLYAEASDPAAPSASVSNMFCGQMGG
ncbi:MAG: PAN domain-containing protein [Roseovarius sp.]|nr:PAN domain-containing protein [Roseovarius sp.]